MAKAFVFARMFQPRVAWEEFGHVGWGFEVRPGVYSVGAIEYTGGQKSNNGFWAIETDKPLVPFGLGPKVNGKQCYEYGLYKVLEVARPNVQAAQAKLQEVKRKPYAFVGNNCLDSTYAILKAFGASPLPDISWGNLAPANWFKSLPGRPTMLNHTRYPIHFTFYEHPGLEGDGLPQRHNHPFEVADLHRKYPGREIGDCVSSIHMRSGYVRIFEHPNFQGRSASFGNGKSLYVSQAMLRQAGMEDKVSSFKASNRPV